MFSYVRGEEATEALAAFAKDTDPTIVVPALEAIGRQNQPAGMKLLLDRIEDPRWQIRSAVLKGLSYFKNPEVMDALIAAAKKEEGVLRRKYFAAMARIVQEQVPGTVEAWESFWKDNKEDYLERWKRLPVGEPVEGDPPDIPIDTNLGSTSFYGIRTNSKHIIFVVDISGSMGEQGGKNEAGDERIDVARKELKGAIKSMSATDEDERGAATFNVVLFSTGVEVYKPGKMVAATVKNKEKVTEWIEEKVKATAQTNIYDAIEQAFNIISRHQGREEPGEGRRHDLPDHRRRPDPRQVHRHRADPQRGQEDERDPEDHAPHDRRRAGPQRPVPPPARRPERRPVPRPVTKKGSVEGRQPAAPRPTPNDSCRFPRRRAPACGARTSRAGA